MGGELRSLGRRLESDDHRRGIGTRIKSLRDGVSIEGLGSLAILWSCDSYNRAAGGAGAGSGCAAVAMASARGVCGVVRNTRGTGRVT